MSFTIAEVQHVINKQIPRDAIPFYKEKDNAMDRNNNPIPAGWVTEGLNNSLIVIYRGTISAKEIKSDISAARTEISFGNQTIKLHSGFKRQFELSQKQMQEAIQELDPNVTRAITFTGHSMGAAVAQIAALKHKIEKPSSKVKVITTGGPRVFSPESAQLYNDQLGLDTLRVKTANDLVCNLPPKGLYAHAGYLKVKAQSTSTELTHHPFSYQNIVNLMTQEILDNSQKKGMLLKVASEQPTQNIIQSLRASLNTAQSCFSTGVNNKSKTTLLNK